jgi:hypothetical protein
MHFESDIQSQREHLRKRPPNDPARPAFGRLQGKIDDADWESCAKVIDPLTVRDLMKKAW